MDRGNAVTLLEELVGDYPRIWNFYKHSSDDNSRNQKYAQRYPIPMGTLSLIIDFHKWTHVTSRLVSRETGLPVPRNATPSEAGPCPLVILRLNWLSNAWTSLEAKQGNLDKTLAREVSDWHSRIRRRVDDGDTYTYTPAIYCSRCNSHAVMRVGERYVCVNGRCRDPFTGEWFSWQIP